ncbi:LysR family transcriptional regulator [Paraburkholderia sp. 22099]|jgi:DNA-binding transcriptional LysR family regulator|uniref:Transcriptional regulator, LysR family n=1 Tax=Paraburkholderia terricola TaxID=169427 RepID=A0A1M6RBF5_9BURK|nr:MULTISPECIES: LysR family transcriptional regulator [Paraburkholderia]ORC45518.1 LysR family transcriptional regulator [Burkholderia sp. A27]MDR6449037.1 DNA-binding transcriptional LysR family regulator [Paraburkholderia terricola]MDR6495148.1 DNA-binding transcriptional LysR family regulator [Paraburkholderia terricola]SDP21276.1 transcriptional regulator, LysR family [Paraburkholderia sediminicola]SHK29799.1 transcriptional regulator, LysR family [Paraburkholderia terricola]
MQLDDMRIFVATVDAHNFTAAARRLALSKQFVSRRVMALEEALGVQLLIRNTRKLAVTELGQEFYERAKRILGEVEDAEQAMSLRRAGPRGLLRVSAPMSFGMTHLSPLVAAFLREHGDVRFDMELSDRTADVVGEGFDMAIRIGTLADSTLIAQKLVDVRMVACCSPGYRRRRGAPAAPADLQRHACLLYGHGGAVNWEFIVEGAHKSIEVHGPLRANNGELIRDAAVAGLGIARLPDFIVADALKSGKLVTVLEEFLPAAASVYAVYPQHRQSSLTIRAFVEFLRKHLKKQLAA